MSERLIIYCWVKSGLLLNEPVADELAQELNNITIPPEEELFEEVDQLIQEEEEYSEDDDLIILEPVPEPEEQPKITKQTKLTNYFL